MRSKFEAWIPTLGREVDATKTFDTIEIRSLDSDLGFRGSGCDEASVEVN